MWPFKRKIDPIPEKLPLWEVRISHGWGMTGSDAIEALIDLNRRMERIERFLVIDDRD